MKVVMVGTGYVGLVSGTCFAEFGMDVVCVDTDASKINALNNGEIPIFEPGLDDLVKKQVDAERLTFTQDLQQSLLDAAAVFIAVGTPPRPEDGHADLTYVYEAAKQIAQGVNGYTVIVNKSTVPVGTAREVENIVAEHKNDNSEIDVCSNPEFLREGSAIKDFMAPDRVVVGTESEKAINVLKGIYKSLTDKNVPLMITSPETSETIKYAANAFLATKIMFINQMADLCEASGANVLDVATAMGQDARISNKFLNASPGYGGACFPKDTLALAQTGQLLGAPQTLVEAVVEGNIKRKEKMAQKIIAACGGNVVGMKIGVLGVAFKGNTDDVREAPSLTILPILQKAGASITAYDAQAQFEASKHLNNIEWVSDMYDVASDADAVVLMTAWDEFTTLCIDSVSERIKTKRLIDLHNIFDPEMMSQKGFHYVSVGRPEVNANNDLMNTIKEAS